VRAAFSLTKQQQGGADNMPVFRVEKLGDYAVIAKHHLKNRALSYKAKGLMTFMLGVPDDWDFSLSGLATLASDGIDGVRSGIRELEKHGYLTRRRIRDDNGRLGDIEYTIHEMPQIPGDGDPDDPPDGSPRKPDEPTWEKPTLEKPTLEKPTLEKPMLVLPTLENPTQLNNNRLNNKKLSIKGLNNKEINRACPSAESGGTEQLSLYSDNTDQQAERLTVKTAQGADTSADHAMTLVDRQFEEFWQLYPRKAGKKAAKKAWSGIAPDAALFAAIMSAIGDAKRYWTIHGISQKHIPHPSTWLNEERWDDEYSADDLSSANKGGEHHGEANYQIGGDNDPYRDLMPN
jgi:hypothetical protein